MLDSPVLKDPFRRILLVAARLSEGRLTELTPAVQPGWREQSNCPMAAIDRRNQRRSRWKRLACRGWSAASGAPPVRPDS